MRRPASDQEDSADAPCRSMAKARGRMFLVCVFCLVVVLPVVLVFHFWGLLLLA